MKICSCAVGGAPLRDVSHWFSSHRMRSFAEMYGVGCLHLGQKDCGGTYLALQY